jgi:hypothetical protein
MDIDMSQTCLIAILFLQSALPQSMSPAAQTVSGVVVSSAGLPVPGAQVDVMALGTSGSVGRPIWAQTDSNGEFHVLVQPGRYQIRAKDEADGYPDPNFLLSYDSGAKFPEIVVADKSIQGLKVGLGARGGTLEGSIYDEVTRMPIGNAKVTIKDARSPSAYVEVFTNNAGRFQFAVPPKPITLSAIAPGYATAYYQNSETLLLSDGEHRSVSLPLVPR